MPFPVFINAPFFNFDDHSEFQQKMFKFIKFNKFDLDETKNQEKILAGRDLRSKVNSTLEVTVSNMTQTAVNELFVEKLSRPSSVSSFSFIFFVQNS